MKKLLPLLLAIMLIPSVLADFTVVINSGNFLYLFPFIIVIELIAFWLLANKAFNIKVNIWKSLLIVSVANVVTSLIGTVINVTSPAIVNFLIISMLLSALIEFGVYLLFFIKEKTINKLNLLWISLIVNFFSYLPLFILFFH